MSELELRLVVRNYTDDQINDLYTHFDALASTSQGTHTITVTAAHRDGNNRLKAARDVIDNITRLTGLEVIDLDLDLVDTSEIASRTGRTRQSVNLLANGKRGNNFPNPYAVISGHRIWTWACINQWLRLIDDNAADPLDHLTRDEQRQLAAWIVQRSHAMAPSNAEGKFTVLIASHVMTTSWTADLTSPCRYSGSRTGRWKPVGHSENRADWAIPATPSQDRELRAATTAS